MDRKPVAFSMSKLNLSQQALLSKVLWEADYSVHMMNLPDLLEQELSLEDARLLNDALDEIEELWTTL